MPPAKDGKRVTGSASGEPGRECFCHAGRLEPMALYMKYICSAKQRQLAVFMNRIAVS